MFRDQAHHFLFGLFLFSSTVCNNLITSNDIDNKIIQLDTDVTFIEAVDTLSGFVPIGKNVTLVCKSNLTDGILWWTFNAENITDSASYSQSSSKNSTFQVSYLIITYTDLDLAGNYTCNAVNENKHQEDTIVLNVTLPIRIIDKSETLKVKAHEGTTLHCVIEGYPVNNVRWLKDEDINTVKFFTNHTIINNVNETVQNVTLQLSDLTKKDSGKYMCVTTGVDNKDVSEEIVLLILDKPQVQIDSVKALGTNMIYLNWTINDGNDPDNLKYTIQYVEDDTEAWFYYPMEISGSVTHAVLENSVFKNDTGYSIRIEPRNSMGTGQKSNIVKVKTLAKNPEFIPEVKVTGVTVSSITVSWSPLPADLVDLIHYYQLKLWSYKSTTQTEAIHSTPGDHLYMFRDLIPATTYEFQVAACSEYTKKCCPWSNVINGTTLDGISDPPENVSLMCRFDNISHTSFVFVSWAPPKNSNGKITHYNVVLEGGASFINDQGITENITWGPKMTSVSEKYYNTRFYNISANTNYTVKISAVTRMKKHGKHVVTHCTMPPTTPDKSKLSQYSWSRVEEEGKWMFKLFLPRMSERNGAICCYRVYMIRMENNKGLAELSAPEDLHVGNYHEAHRTPKGGVYVAEMFSSENYQTEIFLGDDRVMNYTNSSCTVCTGISSNMMYRDRKSPDLKHVAPTESPSTQLPTVVTTYLSDTTQFPDMSESGVVSDLQSLDRLRRYSMYDLDFVPPFDGSLDIASNYTGFVEIVVYGNNKGETLTTYSNYFSILNPGPEVTEAPSTHVLGIVVQILCVLILVVLVLLMALCVLHRYTKQVAHVQGIEMITFRNSFRHLCRSLRGRHRLVSLSPPDMSPISNTDLVNIYMERHRDSDYGFQREFELLPDRFSDRTTRASEARENIYKNRYPDIKAYDQTRVKLAQIDSISGSDYINANFVVSYKERKKFICAQGPMDNTVCDYWRMIWEQRLELILMLTNLEEYSKTKCAKYWPDKMEGEKSFGDITVTHVEEKRCSDYVIRQLRVCKQNTGRGRDERIITQYHYLVWKDFMAPEHPHGIIKFIKRMNEAYSLEKGSILVHCSAGVGRTGTLVALDSLLQQLAEEGQVAIFNTVCDLRHQRNFLVQSLKQYIFIYRALMEVAQYGDTEIQAPELKSIIDKLKRSDSGKCKMEDDYEKIKNAVEDRKSFTVGGGEENHQKNRSDLVIPYDRNRVILTPIPGREHSTYINASFIEGYDNSESFIITQDPLESTIADFWRMISEQGICVIVMLSNLGDSIKKCPRYWPDDENTYDHIFVKYIQSESCPYYTRREFIVTNNKSDENLMVTQFQYHGWPTVEGEVPEVTRGLIELVDQTQAVQEQHGNTGPIVVHCNFGSDRSSMFVGLSILIQQLKVEKRVDVFTTTRKLRSQRQGMISTFAQYEFLHRAIVNYADLHQLCDNL